MQTVFTSNAFDRLSDSSFWQAGIKCTVDRWHAASARMKSFLLRSYATHAYRHEAHVVYTAHCSSTHRVPYSSHYSKTQHSLGTAATANLPVVNYNHGESPAYCYQLFPRQFYRFTDFNDLQLSVLMTFQLQRISTSLNNIIRTFVN